MCPKQQQQQQQRLTCQVLGRSAGAQTGARQGCGPKGGGHLDGVFGPGCKLPDKHRLEIVRNLEEQHGQEQEQPMHF